MATTKRRKRALKQRRQRKIAAITTAVVLVLAIAAVVLWLVFDRTSNRTIQNYPVEYEAFIRESAAQNDLSPA